MARNVNNHTVSHIRLTFHFGMSPNEYDFLNVKRQDNNEKCGMMSDL